jgi:predicted MPP superfamily phosphohydrolase
MPYKIMFRFKHSIIALVFICAFLLFPLLFLAGCGSGTPQPVNNNNNNNVSGNTGNGFLLISDIHFNPYYDPALVPELMKTDASQWEPIFAKSAVKGFGAPGKDETNYPLLVSTLQNMARTADKPDFIIFTGDFLAHQFDTRLKSGTKPDEDYSSFVKKTISFLALVFSKYLPGQRVYFCLGNNDCDTGDYQIVPGGSFLKDTAPIFAANFIKDADNQKSFNQTYPSGGYYAVTPLNSPNTSVISLNTSYFSVKYAVKTDEDPGNKELDWFENQLKDAKKHGKKVWLLMHIPPGANVFSTVSKKEYVPMWQTHYNDRFIQLLKDNAAVITGSFAGHTHMDDFRVLVQAPEPTKEKQAQLQPQALSFIRICPAISPQFGNNPGYQQFSYDRRSFSLIDFDTYWLNLEVADPLTAIWQKEYRFSTAFGQNAINANSMLTVYNGLKTDPTWRGLYTNYYNVGNLSQPVITDANFKAYHSGIGNWTETDFSACSGIQ